MHGWKKKSYYVKFLWREKYNEAMWNEVSERTYLAK